MITQVITLNIDIEKSPFSRAGAYLALSKDPKHLGGGIWLRNLIRPEWGTGRPKISDRLLRFLPTDAHNGFLPFETACTPWDVQFHSGENNMGLYFSHGTQLVGFSQNSGLVLEHNHGDLRAVSIQCTDNSFCAFFPVINRFVDIHVLEGELSYNPATNRIFIKPAASLLFTITVYREKESLPQPKPVEDIAAIQAEYEAFEQPYRPACYTEQLSCYTLWSTIYDANGYVTRRCNAISKGLMNLVWSWDNCFNGLAVFLADKKLALDNVLVFFDHLKPNGMMPDALNPDIIVNWYTKPPVQGFTIQKMLDMGLELSEDEKQFIYEKFSAWTNWWYANNCHQGLFYYSHPFDSGWDNATHYDSGSHIITPELNAYLVMQQDFLANLATALGLKEDAQRWQQQANTLLDTMIAKLWNGQEFLCQYVGGETFKTLSLIKMMPVVLGKRLPQPISQCLVEALKEENHYLTKHGVATESLKSALYDHRKGDVNKPNAYWRGPIWPPVIYLILHGLDDLQETALSDTIAQRFTGMIEGVGNAFYENYDALTGEGNDDIGYTWTSAVYTLLKLRYKN